ncbi:MAG: CBS domain-containing protein [Hyphomicrobiaceae bacterium]
MIVADILQAKGDNVVTVRPTETLSILAHRLRLERVGALVVSTNGKRIDGIISERDVVHAFAEHGTDLDELCVSDVMTRTVTTCSPKDTIADISGIMTKRRIRHLPVVENDTLVGIVTVGDVVKHRLDEMQLEANVLRDYAIAHH